MASIDVTIRGAGIFGLSVAWACQSRGARVQVIDPGGVAAGASGGVVGALAPHTPDGWTEKKQVQFDSLVMAEALWAEVAEISGRDPGYARTGRVQPLADDRAVALARDRAADAARNWGGRFAWQVHDNPAPLGLTSPTGLYLQDTLSARVHPARATAALAQALRRRGAKIATDAREEGVVVEATGAAGLQALSARLGAAVGAAVKGQAAVLAHDAGRLPQLFAGGMHVVPHSDGSVAIGSTSERTFDAADTTDAQLDDLISAVRRLVPGLADAPVIARWAGLRPRARSRAPMLGADPTRPGRFIANGGFKIGFGVAPAIAGMMADLILEGRDTIPHAFRLEASLPATARPAPAQER